MSNTKNDFAEWVTEHFLTDLRSGTCFTESVVENIARFPYIDIIRRNLTSDDRDHILALLDSANLWEVRLGISIARTISDEQIVARITAHFFNNSELRIRLSAVFALAELATHLMPELVMFLNEVITEQPKQLLVIVKQFYGAGEPPANLIGRVARNSPGKALYILLLGLFPSSSQAAA